MIELTNEDRAAIRKYNISDEQLKQWEQEAREKIGDQLKGEKKEETIVKIIRNRISETIEKKQYKEKKKKKKVKVEEREEEVLTLEDVKKLPDYAEDNDTIPVYVVYRKAVNGCLKEFFSKVYVNDGVIEEILLEKPLSIPRETAPSPDFLNKDYGSLKEIYNELRDIHKDYIYFEEDIHYDETVLTAMSSYFREIFYTYPFLDFWSEEQGCGKTTAMETVAFTSFYGTVTASFSEPVVFREIDDSHNVYGFDNIDRILEKPRDYSNIVDLWNSSYSKNIPCKRVEKIDDRWVVVNYDGYSIKIFTHIKDFPSALRALKSRCIRFVMLRRQPKKLYPAPKKFVDIRDKLYHARLKEYRNVEKAYSDLIASNMLTGRTADLYYPLLAIAKLIGEDVYERVLKHAKITEEERNEYDEWNRILVQVLLEDELFGEIDSSTVQSHYQIKLFSEGVLSKGKTVTTQTVTKRLKGLGFKRTNKKTDNKTWFLITEERVKELAYQYGIIELDNNVIPPEKPNFSNFSNSEHKNDDQKEESIDDILIKEAVRNEIEEAGENGNEKLEELENSKRTEERDSFLIQKNNELEKIRKERISTEKRYISNFSNSEEGKNIKDKRKEENSLNKERTEQRPVFVSEEDGQKLAKLAKLAKKGGISNEKEYDIDDVIQNNRKKGSCEVCGKVTNLVPVVQNHKTVMVCRVCREKVKQGHVEGYHEPWNIGGVNLI